MPTVAVVEGVKVQFYPNDHAPPHFHAVIAEHRAVVDMKTMTIVAGTLPASKRQTLLRWAIAHRVALGEAWVATQGGRKPREIR